MAALTRFEELFGDEASDFASTPELQDVVPGLVASDSQYSSKELNKGRKAVTGRSFRSPVPRSLPTNKFSAPPEAQAASPAPFEYDPLDLTDDGTGGGPGGGGGLDPGVSGSQGEYRVENPDGRGRLGEGTLGNEIGDSLAGSLGTMGLLGMLSTGGAALSAGVPSSMLPGILSGSFVQSALNPVTAANTVGGGLVAGQMAHTAGTNTGDPFAPASTQSQASQIAAFNAINPGMGGLAEMGIEAVMSALFGTKSNTEKAQQAAAIGMNAAVADTNAQAAAQGAFAGDQGVQGTNTLGTGTAGTSLTGSAPTTNMGTSLGSFATGTIGSAAMGELMGEVAAPQGENLSGSTGMLGTTGAISQGLQGMGFGGNVSGVGGVGLGGSTNAETGMQQGLIGPAGINPHASEMGIVAAPTPTVGGSQGVGVGGSGAASGAQSGFGEIGAPTGQAQGASSMGSSASSSGSSSGITGSATGEVGDDGGGGGAGK